MTVRGGKVAGLVAGVVAGLAVAGVGVFFVVTGVDNANRWSGVLGFFVGVLGLGVSVFGAVLTRRSLRSSAAPSTGSGGVGNTIRGGTFHQPAVQGRDISGLNIGSPATSAGSPTITSTGSGDVRNTISGGTFGQPAIQGRDISGLSLGSPAAPPDGGDAASPPPPGPAA